MTGKAWLGLIAVGLAACAAHGDSARDASVDADGAALARPGPAPGSEQAVRDALAHDAACLAIRPFYWEIGGATGAALSGSEGTGYTQSTQLEIASASKWLYAAYYLQKHQGQLADDEVKFFNFTSGHASVSGTCVGQTVAGCNQSNQNGAPGTTAQPGASSAAVGRFTYNSGHLEAHAERFGELGPERALTLGRAIGAQLGDDIALSYVNPLLAGGGRTSAADYARFLRKIMNGELAMHALLGTHATCTLSADYASLFKEQCDALLSPWWPALSGKLADTADSSLVQNVHYSLGHWVEADGAFSSPGLFGFYPWIDKDQAWYGIIARRQVSGAYDEAHPDTSAYAQSVRCGQALRSAWIAGKSSE